MPNQIQQWQLCISRIFFSQIPHPKLFEVSFCIGHSSASSLNIPPLRHQSDAQDVALSPLAARKQNLKLPSINRGLTVNFLSPIFQDLNDIIFSTISIHIDISNDFVLDLEPQFLIQRSIKGYTKSFVKKDESITTEKVKRDASFKDYFSLKSQIKGRINKGRM